MDFSDISSRGLVLLGCGKMGSALLQGWLDGGLAQDSVWVMDPYPSDWVKGLQGLHLNTDLPEDPAIVVIAVKPQMMDDALPQLKPLGNGTTLFVTIAAGTPIRAYERVLGAQTPFVRAMPNTPAAIGQGMTALIGNAVASQDQLNTADGLLSAVGHTIFLDDEGQMDAVTGLSGSGPAYVFHLIETLAAAGEDQGLPADMAMRLATATVAGAGALAQAAAETPSELRVNVTSPGGTTAAALEVLMHEETGFPSLLNKAVRAATDRSKELGE